MNTNRIKKLIKLLLFNTKVYAESTYTRLNFGSVEMPAVPQETFGGQFAVVRGGATILRVGEYNYYCEQSEQKIFWVVPPIYAILGGTTATKRGIRRAYRIALLQYLTVFTGRARAILASI